MTRLTDQQIRLMLTKAVEKAEQIGVNICVAIVDDGANLQGFLRMDKARLGPVEVAQSKAKTAIYFHADTGEFGKVMRNANLTGIEMIGGGIMGFAGGLPIRVGDEVIGGIGVSGATAEQDKEVAEYALQSVL